MTQLSLFAESVPAAPSTPDPPPHRGRPVRDVTDPRGRVR